MNLTPTPLKGLYLVDLEARTDDRGSFAEAWNAKTFEKKGLKMTVDQANFSTSAKKGTFRGYHYQASPAGQTKTVFAVRGAALDLAIDIRRGSPTYLKAFQAHLTPENGVGLHIPPGFAHGWLALQDDCQIVYFVEGGWSRSHERGVRYNDPWAPKIPGITIVNGRDKAWPLIEPNT